MIYYNSLLIINQAFIYLYLILIKFIISLPYIIYLIQIIWQKNRFLNQKTSENLALHQFYPS